MVNQKQRNRISEFSWRDVLSCRNEIFGFAAIWIILFHIYDNIGFIHFRYSFLFGSIFSVGNCGVDIFLFLSAIGLRRSMEKNDVKTFYKNRFLRIAMPYLITAIPYFVWYDFLFAKDGLWQFLLNLSTVNYWLSPVNYPIWYVSFVVILYALYPWIYRMDVKTRHIATAAMIVIAVVAEYCFLVTGSIVYTNAERALSRIPVFLLGVIMAPYVLEGKRIRVYQVILAAAAWIGGFLLVIFGGLHLVMVRYLYAALAVSFLIVFSFIRKYVPLKPLYRILGWLGAISFELYAVHVFMARGLRHVKLWGIFEQKLIWYFLIPLAAVAAAKLVSLAAARLNARLFCK